MKLKEIKLQLAKMREEIIDLENDCCLPGSGFGDPDALAMHLRDIQFKKDNEARLARDYNEIIIQRIKSRQLITSWLAAIAAICSALIAGLELFNHF